jgi:FAD/FMN-containing dehydrogenase
VTADGRRVRASADEEAELFWGLRGAGANFGIATAFEFDLHPLRPDVTFGTVTHPVQRLEALADRYRELVQNGPDELWASFGLGLSDGDRTPVATVTAFHCGDADEAERDLAALRSLAPPLSDSIRRTTYLAAQRAGDEAMRWGHRFYMKSGFLPSLPDALVAAWAGRLAAVPEGTDGGFSLWSCGRAMAAVADETTAFTGRDAGFWAAVEVLWDDPALDDACRAWVRTAMEDAAPYASTGRYVNDVADVGEGLARSVYGDAKYERLVVLKRAWDPDNVFRLNQNIRPHAL